MCLRSLRTFIPLILFLLLVGCAGGDGGGRDSLGRPWVPVTLSGTFEDNPSASTRPLSARYSYVEVLDSTNNQVLASGYLDDKGKGTVDLPSGASVRMRLYARILVPSETPNRDNLHGSVKTSAMQASYEDLAAFDRLADVRVEKTFSPIQSGATYQVHVPFSAAEAGAFNIADQMVAFAIGMDILHPGIELPDLHAFWYTAAGNQGDYTSYPKAALDSRNNYLKAPYKDSASGAIVNREIYQFKVRRAPSGAPDAGMDAFNTSVLQASICRLLSADAWFYDITTKSYRNLLRCDNDNAFVERTYPSEPAIAFVHGFCDFLSCAFRGDPVMTVVDEQGNTQTFDLSKHGQVNMLQGQGEFYRGAISVSLYNIWTKVLNGNMQDLQLLYRTAVSVRGTLEYNNAPLACYPTYLRGLRNTLGLTSPAWNRVLSELALEEIGDVTQDAYFNSSALWTTIYPSTTVTGALATHASAIYYDRNQAEAFRFTELRPTPRRITMIPTGGQDLFLELFSSTQGLIRASWDSPYGGNRVINIPDGLPAGEYLVRVRAGVTSAETTASYTLIVE